MNANTVIAQMALQARNATASHHFMSPEDMAALVQDWKRADELGVRFGACWVWMAGHHWLISPVLSGGQAQKRQQPPGSFLRGVQVGDGNG